MSAVIHKPSSDGSPSGASFSYAQAAKGRTPSIPSTLASGKPPSESDDLGVRRVSVPEPKNTPIACPKVQTEDLVGNSREGAVAKPSTEPVSTPSSTAELNSKMTAPELQPNAEGQVHTPPSIPPSPSSGTASTSTLPKEDEALSSANGSSDSTWEKLSQGSQNGNKTSEKPESDKEQVTSQAWDEEPTTPSLTSLKEAPPPAVNVWQYRKELADARAKTMSASLQIPKPQIHTGGNANSNTGIKPSENPLEMRKQDTKKRGKNIPGQPEASAKEVTRATETKPRNGEEGSEKGARRASRMIDVDKSMPATVAAPPPPGDATSWPTPDSAQGEEKKKAHERAEKGEKEKTPASKPHGREKWTPVPYVPTAIFNTPLPAARRGGRASRGGRDASNRGHSTMHGSSGPDKPSVGPSDGSVFLSMANSSERGRADPSSFKNNSGSFKPKRAVSAGPSTVREQRKISDAQVVDRVKETAVGPGKANQNPGPSAGESRRTSTATQTDDGKVRRFSSTNGGRQTGEPENISTKGSQFIGERDGRYQTPHLENQSNARPTGPERRNENSVRQSDNTRDFHGHVSNRERGEGRGERGRGSYRGRSNHGYPNSSQANGQNFSHGHPSQSSASTPHQLSKTQNSHERHASQSQATPFHQSHTTSRNFRSNNRAQPLPHSATYSRFSNGSSTSHPGAPPLAPLQTDLANAYGYHPGSQGVMSAITYNPYYEHLSLYGMVTVQMEYYFSVDNLCKDLFLRGQMDSQGFVFLSVLAGFNRIKMLTQEMEMIRYVCINSQHIEFRQGLDGIDRIRKRDGWQQWVLSKEDRDPSAQNDGSVQSPQQRVPHSQSFDVAQTLQNHAETNKQFSSSSHSVDEGMFRMSNGVPPPFVPIPSASANSSNMTEGPLTQTPLSAAVPDFAPSAPSAPSAPPPTEQALPSTDHGPLPIDPTVPAASAFTDDQVESLMIVVRKPVNPSASPPFPPASSQTLSNGSIDGRTNNEALSKFEEHQPKLRIEDGESHVGETPKAKRSWSPFSLASTSRRPTNYASPVFWVKDKDTPIDSLPDDLTHESYHVFRRNALLQREHSTIGNCHRDMDILYQFWSHFLIRNFNTRMYEEFRRIAFEDAMKQGSTVGIKNLVQYYAESILGQKTISDEIARDFVDLVKDESSDRERPAFDKLRAAWRNGAFNMKNRKKIDKILDVDLKAELER